MPLLLIPRSAASGTTINRTVNDALGVSDSPITRTVSPTGVEPVGVTDTVSPVLTSALIERSVTDAAGVTDSVAVTVTFAVSVTDTAGATDTAGVAATHQRNPQDTAGVTDAVAVASVFARDVSDAVGVTESVSSGSSASQSIADTATVSDTVTVAVTYALAVNDTAGVSDTAGVVATHQRIPSDTVGVSDSGQSLAYLRDGVSPVGVTDEVTPTLTPLIITRSVNDTIGVTDTGTSVAAARFGADTIGVSDTVQASLGTATISRSINDTVEVRDSDDPETVQIIESVSVNDTAGITDTVSPVKTATATAVTCRATVGVAAQAATQLRPVLDLAAWVAKWDAIPLVGAGTGDGGWRAGDGMWSVTHSNGASALFSFGDTPVSRITAIVESGVQSTSQNTTTAWLTVADAQAVNHPVGSRVRVFLSDGTTPRYAGNRTWRVTGSNSAFGFTNLFLDFGLPSAPAIGDVIKRVTGGEEWWMFPPHSSAVLWTNGQMRHVTGIDSWIPRDTSSDWYWAGPMVMQGTDLYVFPTKQDDTGVPWADVGRGLFRFSWANHTTAPTGVTKITTWGLDPCWGAAVVQQGGFYYIFGTYRQRTAPVWLDNEVYVARTASMAADPTTWEFWTTTGGGSWQTGAGYLTSRAGLQVVVAHDDVNGLENTFSAHYADGVFVLASKRGGVFGSDVAFWTSTTVTGPYTRRVVGSAPNDTPTANDQTYLTNAHFNLPRLANGKTLISVSRNRDGQTIQSFFDTDPSWYRPLWLEVDAQVRPVTTRATVGAVPRGTTGHVSVAAARVASGVAASSAARHVNVAAVRGVAGASVSAAARHAGGVAVRGAVGASTVTLARKVTAENAVSAVGAAARAAVTHLAASTARGAAGAASAGVTVKRTAVTGASRAGLASSFLLTGGRLVGSRVALGAQAVLVAAGHRTTAVTHAETGAYAAVSARKAAPGVSGAAVGSAASTAPRKAAPGTVRGVAGTQALNSGVGHRVTAAIRSFAGVAQTSTGQKRAPSAAVGVVGAQGRHSGSLARAVSVTAAAGFQAVTAAYRAALAVLSVPLGVGARSSVRHTATPVTAVAVGGAARGVIGHRGSAAVVSAVSLSGVGSPRKRMSGTVAGALAVSATAGAGRRAPVTIYTPMGGMSWGEIGAQPITGGSLTGGDRSDLASVTITDNRRVPVLTGGVR